MPSLIRPRYKFVINTTFSDISFLKYREAWKRHDEVVLQF
ncbi:hypothetical protein BTN49_1405 [Candidatus Enterovibrio escicola]|uniref:Uncharacterized protein n=1 Tax=Candidatus Enterovibrio escicola TaxID=1927127 RepID=A0A2A5T3X5_9GAMM|nr:hypothetical protein BTN49_1405 [Candidatus Enterovibrio escacola]